jgi:hypothetical protein
MKSKERERKKKKGKEKQRERDRKEKTNDSGREGFATVWVAMAVVAANHCSSFAITSPIASLCSLISVVRKKREKMINKGGQTVTKRKKIAVGAFQEIL